MASALPVSSVRYLEIDAVTAGQRIDNFLLRHLKGVPKSHVYRLLRRGEVRVNKGRVKPAYRLRAGDRVRLPPGRTANRTETHQAPTATRQTLERAILFEDDALIVMNKPAGFAVHGGSGLDYGVIEALRQARPETPGLELVHRLDRDTSGCLVIAKTRANLPALNRCFQQGAVVKHYLTLVAGDWRGGARTVDMPLQRTGTYDRLQKVVVKDTGKAARSRFTPLEHFEVATLMEICLWTGRMHQIRAHAAYLGHPVAGDRRYGDPSFNRSMRQRGLKRMFLHASRLAFTLPEKDDYHIEAPLDTQLTDLLERLARAGSDRGAGGRAR